MHSVERGAQSRSRLRVDQVKMYSSAVHLSPIAFNSQKLKLFYKETEVAIFIRCCFSVKKLN